MYNIITRSLIEQRKQHNEGKRFEVKLRDQLCNVTRIKKISKEQISAINNIYNLGNITAA